MTKDELRNQSKAIRSGVVEKERLSQDINFKLIAMFRREGFRNVSSYVSMGTEVDTSILLDYCLKEFGHIAIPNIEPNMNMGMVRLESLDELVISNFNFGQLNPNIKNSENRDVGSSSLDVIIVPLLAFDISRNRLGYGKGNYDKYLSTLSNNVPKVGIAFSSQIIDSIPVEAHDVQLDIIITESNQF